jgi:hypothetical protein
MRGYHYIRLNYKINIYFIPVLTIDLPSDVSEYARANRAPKSLLIVKLYNDFDS